MTRETRAVGLVLLGALLVKGAFILYLGERAYHDFFRGVHFGFLLDQGIFSIERDHVLNKTFVGPALWFAVFERFGVAGLKVVNLLLFTALFAVQHRLGRDRYPPRTVLAALFITAFYVGTNRNVVAGEPDDLLAALLFSLGVGAYLRGSPPPGEARGSALAAGLLMGAGFVFKYWIAIFCAGFGLYLLSRGRWRELAIASLGMGLPFALVNLVDRGASWRGLLFDLGHEHGSSDWRSVGVKMVSTGMLPAFALATAGWWRDRRETTTLFYLVPAAFFAYVIVNRDAQAITFLMTQCLVLWSFSIAELLLTRREGTPQRVLRGLAGAYVVLATGVTYHNLDRDVKACDRPRAGRPAAAVRPGVPSWQTSADDFVTAPWCAEMRSRESKPAEGTRR